VDDWSFGPVESPLGAVAGVVEVPWRFSSEVFVAVLSVGLVPPATGHPRVDRRLGSADLLDVTGTSHLLVRASRPRPNGGGWSLIGMLRLGRVVETVPVIARVMAPAIDSAGVKVDVTICRRDFGLARYPYRIGPHFRLHIDAELSRAGSDGRR
jgi:polyisoprenoid-binding protein YceI